MSVSKASRARRSYLRRQRAASEVRAAGDGRRARMCTRKKGYPCEAAAIEGALGASRRFGRPFKWYRCPYCRKWHIARGGEGS